ncbi:MAG: DUF6607 family protein [Bacteroidota bacterium]
MKRAILLSMFVFVCVAFVNAQTKKEKDLKAIKGLCGCHEVGFNFAETFQYADDENYKASKNYSSGGLEWVQLVEEDDNTVVLQHLLIVGKPDEPYIIKHWRQDWLYENTDLYMFNHDNKWTYTKKSKEDVAGQWTQKVFQVDDSPRYEGTASWVHVDGKSYWENITDAPLPRREYSKRSDYNVMVRKNRQEITAEGWVHDQDNQKVLRVDGKPDVKLAAEKGYNIYKKVDPNRCKAAQDWWKDNKEMWGVVRTNWDKVFGKKKDLALKDKVDDKKLFEHLFALEPDTKPSTIKKIIKEFTLD